MWKTLSGNFHLSQSNSCLLFFLSTCKTRWFHCLWKLGSTASIEAFITLHYLSIIARISSCNIYTLETPYRVAWSLLIASSDCFDAEKLVRDHYAPLFRQHAIIGDWYRVLNLFLIGKTGAMINWSLSCHCCLSME